LIVIVRPPPLTWYPVANEAVPMPRLAELRLKRGSHTGKIAAVPGARLGEKGSSPTHEPLGCTETTVR
jgi:hypothetical protein